jgi:biopolymer transport protein ExbD
VNPEVSALLVADKDATLEMVTEIVDAVKGGGVKKVAFSIQKK